ncbi:MAG: hypothetical protein JSS91_11355 [Bacteroidetes bacterium]|nr:hypothetical protein [Bacteroidota bacterium]
MNKSLIKLIIIFLVISSASAQEKKEKITDVENISARNISWAILQTIPSVTWINDRNDINSRNAFGLKWNITPLNISFSTNKFVSPVQFFMVNPMRKYTGSFEVFVQPEWALTSLDYSGYDRFAVSAGGRINIPVKNYGEHLYVSLGGKYNFRNNSLTGKNGYYSIEGGMYVLFGIFGLTYNYNFDDRSKYSFGINFKYW